MKCFQEKVAGIDAHETQCCVLANHQIPQTNQGIGEGMKPPNGTTICLRYFLELFMSVCVKFTLGKLLFLFCISEGPGYLLDAVLFVW